MNIKAKAESKEIIDSLKFLCAEGDKKSIPVFRESDLPGTENADIFL
jgi:hypothetical protein